MVALINMVLKFDMGPHQHKYPPHIKTSSDHKPPCFWPPPTCWTGTDWSSVDEASHGPRDVIGGALCLHS